MTTQVTTQTQASYTEEQLEVIATLVTKATALGLQLKMLPQIDVGPIISLYRVLPSNSTKVSQIEALAQDFAIALHAEDVYIKRIPGEAAIGISVPNKTRKRVLFKDTVTNVWTSETLRVPLNLGVDYMGRPAVDDLSEYPHLLIAGSTGSGKSTLLSAILASIIYCRPASQIKLILSDTKQVEFSHFIGAPHLLFEPALSVYATMERLEWTIDEMERRLKRIAKAGKRNIFEFNALQDEVKNEKAKLPYIIFVIDELATILGCESKGDGEDKRKLGKIAEGYLGKIVQLSRAAGVYIIAATQRPSVNVVSGSIKTNFPARLTFRLPSGADSRTVISTEGAEHLLAQGDMLFMSPNKPGLQRLHAPYAELSEIRAAIEFAVGKST